MSTVMVPTIHLDSPAPRPPVFNLTSSPDAATEFPIDRVPAGITLDKYPSGMPVAFDPACGPNASDNAKDVPEDPSGYTGAYMSFTAYLADICTSYGVAPRWEEWKDRVAVALEARTSWALERQLAWGTYADEDAFLADADAALPAGAAAIPVRNAVAYLEDWLSQFGHRGVLSLTPAAVTALGFDFFRLDGSQLRTAAGTPVIVGAGYAPNVDGSENLDPAASGAGEAAAGASWIFAHPPVKFARWDITFPDEPISVWLDRDDNTVVYRTERQLWVGFDSGPHAAALADWTP